MDKIRLCDREECDEKAKHTIEAKKNAAAALDQGLLPDSEDYIPNVLPILSMTTITVLGD